LQLISSFIIVHDPTEKLLARANATHWIMET